MYFFIFYFVKGTKLPTTRHYAGITKALAHAGDHNSNIMFDTFIFIQVALIGVASLSHHAIAKSQPEKGTKEKLFHTSKSTCSHNQMFYFEPKKKPILIEIKPFPKQKEKIGG